VDRCGRMDMAVGVVVAAAGLAGFFGAIAGGVRELYAAAARGSETGAGEARSPSSGPAGEADQAR
jgi:hypothetical protein